MTRREHALLAGAAWAGLALAIFQIWYVALPLERAAAIDFCRWRHLDCFESLHKQEPLLPILAALAAMFFVGAALSGLAAGAAAPRAEAWLGIARLLSFPTSGLAAYAVLADYMEVKMTSPSAILILLISIATSVHAVVRGGLRLRLREGGVVPLAVVLAAALFGFFLEGAAGAARSSDRAQTEVMTASPTVLFAAFEQDIPREGAVAIGDPIAPNEVLLFLDPAQEASRKLLREVLDARLTDVVVQVYLKDRALPPDGHALLEAAARGEPLPPNETSLLAERIAAEAKIGEYPTAIGKSGRRTGDLTLASVLAR